MQRKEVLSVKITLGGNERPVRREVVEPLVTPKPRRKETAEPGEERKAPPAERPPRRKREAVPA